MNRCRDQRCPLPHPLPSRCSRKSLFCFRTSCRREPRGKVNRRPPALPAPSALAAHLRQLASLRDDGILSEEEFSTKKAEVLARL
ncbi:hypothetical protein C5B99_04080 [Pseudoclavibacter sp. Z016]|nr:hypothetical protein C5B99_04080 [Pseudoclavibacter sp. Z016]